MKLAEERETALNTLLGAEVDLRLMLVDAIGILRHHNQIYGVRLLGEIIELNPGLSRAKLITIYALYMRGEIRFND